MILILGYILLGFSLGACVTSLYCGRKRIVTPGGYKVAAYRLPNGRAIVFLGFDDNIAYTLNLEGASLVHADLAAALSKQEVVS